MKFVLPILVALAGTTAYHVAQRAVPQQMDPRVALTVAYGSALVVCLCSFAFRLPRAPAPWFGQWHWSPVVIGIAIVAVEAGFLIAYRAGWKLSLASAVSNVLTASLLLMIGVTVYRERLGFSESAGLLLCLVGLALILK